MFTLTAAAARQIQQAATESNAQSLVLRVAAKRIHDGQIDYGMGFDDTRDNDMQLEIENVRIVIAPHHLELLQDTVLDFVELEPSQFHFIFIQQAKSPQPDGCGNGGCSHCGNSGTSH